MTDGLDRRRILTEIASDPAASPADRLKALDAIDRLDGLTDDGRGFMRSELDDLSPEEIDSLLDPLWTIDNAAERRTRALLADDDAFIRISSYQRSRRRTMEHLWSQAGAAGGNRSQMTAPRKRLRKADSHRVTTHGNGFGALAELERERLDVIVIGGDLAAGPMPGETLDLLATLEARTLFIRGNTDRELGDHFDAISQPGDAPDEDNIWIRRNDWAARQIITEQRDLLASLPETVALEVDGLGLAPQRSRS